MRVDWSRLKDQRKGLLPGDFAATIECKSVRIGILGLNTAALQLKGGEYKERLSLHPRQLEPLFPGGIGNWVKRHDACLLLTHHPPDWLDTEGRQVLRGEIAWPGRFALHLCGHQHESRQVLESEGGAEPRITSVGRSLFGLKEWGESEKGKRYHGYSVGILEFQVTSRQLRIWPRKSYRQEGDYLEIRKDQSVKTQDDEGMSPRDIGPSPREQPETDVAESTTPTPPPGLTGWYEVSTEFLSSRRSELSNAELTLFFDGQEPSWEHALVDTEKVPRRDLVDQVLGALQSAETNVFIRLLGAAGDGKSTALRQIAAELAVKGWRVLYREDDGNLLAGEPLELPEGGWVLVSDDADQIAPQVLPAVKALHERGRNDIHWVLAARDTDWSARFRAKLYRGEPSWSLYVTEWPKAERRRTLFSMSKEEAAQVVEAWERASCLGALKTLPAEDCQGRSKFGPLRRSKSRPVGEGVAVFVGRLERSLRSPFRAAQA